jgi:hypothetical protein
MHFLRIRENINKQVINESISQQIKMARVAIIDNPGQL